MVGSYEAINLLHQWTFVGIILPILSKIDSDFVEKTYNPLVQSIKLCRVDLIRILILTGYVSVEDILSNKNALFEAIGFLDSYDRFCVVEYLISLGLTMEQLRNSGVVYFAFFNPRLFDLFKPLGLNIQDWQNIKNNDGLGLQMGTFECGQEILDRLISLGIEIEDLPQDSEIAACRNSNELSKAVQYVKMKLLDID